MGEPATKDFFYGMIFGMAVMAAIVILDLWVFH